MMLFALRLSCLVATVVLAPVNQIATADQKTAVRLHAAKDYAAAYRELLPLAEAGDAIAQFFIGRMFELGHHVGQDPAVATRWVRRAADQGYGPAQLYLGAMYARGTGVPVDHGESLRWAALAAINDLAPRDAAVRLRDSIATLVSPDQRRGLEAQIASWSPHREPMPPLTGTAEARRKMGSGFFVDDRGHVLTNYHVVDGCGVLRRRDSAGGVGLTLVAADSTRDLALLRAPIGRAEPVILSDRGPVELGAAVVVLGYTLQAAPPLVTNGIVNQGVGGQGEPGLFQVSAPLRPGVSGGPVLDDTGQLIGVARLDADGTQARQGGVAIGLSVVTAFLAENGVAPKRAQPGASLSTRDISSLASRAAVAIECWR